MREAILLIELDVLNKYSRTSMARTLMAHSPGLWLDPAGHFMHYIRPGWLELPLAKYIFHGPKPVLAIEVLLFSVFPYCYKANIY